MLYFIKQKLSRCSRLIQNVSWLLSVEIVAKLSRLVTIVTMAAFLLPAEYGIAILSVTIHDTLRMLMRSGSGSQVVQCQQSELKLFAQNAACLQWLLCGCIAVLQFAIAPWLSSLYQAPQLAELLQIMAFSYLFYPFVSVNVYLLQRANNMRYFSLCNGSCIIIENLSIAVLLWLDAGIYAVAISKLIFAGLWFGLFCRVPVERFGLGFDLSTFVHLFKTSSQLLGTELAKAGRAHSDVFIAGKVLNPEMFGLYSFAKQAGVGVSQSLTHAFNSALFPYLSELNRQKSQGLQRQKTKKLILGLMAGLSGIFVIQSVLVPIYVPILFKEVWYQAIPAISLLCLSVIANLWLDTLCCYVRALGRYQLELNMRLANLVLVVAALILVPVSTPIAFAQLVLVVSGLWLIPFTFYQIHQYVYRNQAGVTPDRSQL